MYSKSAIVFAAVLGCALAQVMDPSFQYAADGLTNGAGTVYKAANGVFDNVAGTSLNAVNSAPIVGPLASPWLNLLAQWTQGALNLGQVLSIDAARLGSGQTGSDQMS